MRNSTNVYAPLSVILLSMLYAVEVNVGAWVAFRVELSVTFIAGPVTVASIATVDSRCL